MSYADSMESFIRDVDTGIENWRPNNGFFSQVYILMMLALFLTAASSYIVSEYFLQYIYSSSLIIFGLLIFELILVIVLSALANKLSMPVMFALFILYAIINGVTLTPIIVVYTTASVFKAFLTTAVMFGAMSATGYVIKRDLSGIARFALYALIGVLVAILLNVLLFRSGILDMILSLVSVIIFAGLTAYDTQKIKRIANSCNASSKRAIRCAMELYLDFINIFIHLLKIVGDRR